MSYIPQRWLILCAAAMLAGLAGCSDSKEREPKEREFAAKMDAAQNESRAALAAVASIREESVQLRKRITESEAAHAASVRESAEIAAQLAKAVEERDAVRRTLDALRATHEKLLELHADTERRAAGAESALRNRDAEHQQRLALAEERARAEAASAPDARGAGEQLGQLAAEQSQGVVTMSSFTKTDGRKGVQDGVETYTMEYVAEVSFGATCRWLHTGFGPGELEFKVAIIPSRMTPMDEMLFYSTNPGATLRRGDRVQIRGEMHFNRSERGWRLRRIMQSAMEKL